MNLNLFKAIYILKHKCKERGLNQYLISHILEDYENELFKSWCYDNKWFILIKSNLSIMCISTEGCNYNDIINISYEDFFKILINNLLHSINY